jgi:hypothetical protein
VLKGRRQMAADGQPGRARAPRLGGRRL